MIALTGNGVVPTAPAVGLSPTSHAFGNQQTGTTSAAQSFTLTNTGTAALHLGTLALGGASAQFALSADTCSNVELAPLGTCTFAVAFAPTTLGLQNATVTIPSDAASNPDTITLSGTGIAPPAPAISLSTASVSFGDQITGTTSAPQTVTVRNDGDASLVISTVTIGGANSAQFTLGTDSCTGASLDPDDTCTFEVSFAPTAIGPASATVSIASNAASSPDTASRAAPGRPCPRPTSPSRPPAWASGISKSARPAARNPSP
ncbi:MAG: choice-of-anchor D domain-containing protein [Thermomicrobiales bacterium]